MIETFFFQMRNLFLQSSQNLISLFCNFVSKKSCSFQEFATSKNKKLEFSKFFSQYLTTMGLLAKLDGSSVGWRAIQWGKHPRLCGEGTLVWMKHPRLDEAPSSGCGTLVSGQASLVAAEAPSSGEAPLVVLVVGKAPSWGKHPWLWGRLLTLVGEVPLVVLVVGKAPSWGKHPWLWGRLSCGGSTLGCVGCGEGALVG